MLKNQLTVLPLIHQLVYADTGDPPPADPPPADPPPADPPPKTYTQEQVDAQMAATRTKYQQEGRKAVDELHALRTKANLSAKERDELDATIADLNTQLLTKEELADQAKKKAEAAHTEEVTTLTAERDTWQRQFKESTITRNITDAAVESDAFSPQQIVAVIGPNTRLEPVKDDDGNPVPDKFETRVKFDDLDKDGKPVVLDLDVAAAVKRMKEMDTYLNLFKSNGQGGLNQPNRSGGTEPDLKEIAKDPAKWREYREGKKSS